MNIFDWFSTYPKKVGFEDVKKSIYQNRVIINTLPVNDQSCLIKNTVKCHHEEKLINECIEKLDYNKLIIIYGKNSSDNSVYDKYSQLKNIGFSNIYIYCGGVFEWLLLQDVYGFSEFPTTENNVDILKYREPELFI